MFVATQQRLGNARQWQRYTERVTRRMGHGRYEIMLRPLGQYRRLGALGPNASSGISTGASVGTSTALSIAGYGSIAGPVGAGVGVVVGIILALWAAHSARVKGATEENQIVQSAVSTVSSALQAIFQAANAGSITGAQGASLAQQLLGQYWSAVAQVRGLPGVADASNGGMSCGTPPAFGLNTPNTGNPCTGMLGGPPCNKSCTAGCCVGCQDLVPTIDQAVAVLSSPTGGTMMFCPVSSSSFGLSATGSYQLTYTPPKSLASAAGVADAVSSATGISSASTIAGIPTWLIALGVAGFALYELM
jgi:hypothetical protein